MSEKKALKKQINSLQRKIDEKIVILDNIQRDIWLLKDERNLLMQLFNKTF